MLKSNQIKPKVIGYRRVFVSGRTADQCWSKEAMSILASRPIAKPFKDQCIHKNGKQKFRPVYK